MDKSKRPPSGTGPRPPSGAGQHYTTSLASQKYISGPNDFNKMAAKNIKKPSE